MALPDRDPTIYGVTGDWTTLTIIDPRVDCVPPEQVGRFVRGVRAILGDVYPAEATSNPETDDIELRVTVSRVTRLEAIALVIGAAFDTLDEVGLGDAELAAMMVVDAFEYDMDPEALFGAEADQVLVAHDVLQDIRDARTVMDEQL